MAWSVVMLAALYVLLITLLVVCGVGPIGVAVTLAAAVLVQYFASERLALAALGTRPTSVEREPELFDAVERLCIAIEHPMPRLALIRSSAPNAFTVGRAPSTATICVTSGLLALLEGDELDAVLAHELAHIESRDAMVMTFGSLFASLAAFIVTLGRRSDHRPREVPEAEDSPFFGVVILAGLVFLLSYVVLQPLSRRRELAADRRAAAVIGGPEALSAALEEISAALAEGTGVRSSWGELAALAVVPPDVTATVATLFPTHPSLEDRRVALAPPPDRSRRRRRGPRRRRRTAAA